MRIAIVGGGFTGLTAAYELVRSGHTVILFERDEVLGGLAHGWKQDDWTWYLEKAYHHLFTNDRAILKLIKKLGLSDKILIRRPVTANLLPADAIAQLGRDSAMYQLDSPIHLFRFPLLSPIDKIRTAVLLAFLKFNPFWKPLEKLTAEQLLTSIGGSGAWKIIWKPLLVGKFGKYAPTVAASWFWARIKKRTPRLYYIKGGFHTLVDALAKAIEKHGGTILTRTNVSGIRPLKNGACAVVYDGKTKEFDRVLLTVPTPIALKLLPALPSSYTKPMLSIPHLHAQTLILETEKPILKDTYWLNVTDSSFPFLAVVAHTNMVDKRYYGGRHITYFGNYLPEGHPYLSMTKDRLLKEFLPFINKITSHELRIANSYMFVGPFAQPVHQAKYSKKAPRLATPLPHIYLANLDSIYPWDRGTNYAVELGKKAARSILSSRT